MTADPDPTSTRFGGTARAADGANIRSEYYEFRYNENSAATRDDQFRDAAEKEFGRGASIFHLPGATTGMNLRLTDSERTELLDQLRPQAKMAVEYLRRRAYDEADDRSDGNFSREVLASAVRLMQTPVGVVDVSPFLEQTMLTLSRTLSGTDYLRAANYLSVISAEASGHRWSVVQELTDNVVEFVTGTGHVEAAKQVEAVLNGLIKKSGQS